MENNNNDKILIFIFLIVLIIPTIVYPFIKNNLDQTNYENRKLNTMEDVFDSKFETLATNFDSFYKDNLPFKNELQKFRAILKYAIFKTPTSEKVIIGKEDWLFYNSGVDGLTDEVGDYRKTTRFTDDEYALIIENLNTVDNKLKENGKEFYLLIPNNKSSIYPEYMADIYKRNNDVSANKTEALIQIINNKITTNVIYPKDALIKNKYLGKTYYQYDTHWNMLGGFIGVMELVKNIENEDYNMNDYEVYEEKNNVGDLALMNQTMFFANNTEPQIINYNNQLEPICDTVNNITECFTEGAKYDKTLLIIGDSFRTAMEPYLYRTYKHVVVVYVPVFNSSIVEKYNPDVVVYEVVERNLYQLFTLSNYF